MKKIVFAVAVVSILGLASCNKKDGNGQVDSDKVDSAVVDSAKLDSAVVVDSIKAEEVK